MKVFDFEQRSPEWHEVRRRCPTASNFDKIVTTKGVPSKSREKYLYQLVGESISGVIEETYQSAYMLRGIELEAEARLQYEFIMDTEVKQVGFFMDDDNNFGCSPDGLVGENGLIEIKCPSVAVHVEYLLRNKLPTAYFQQVMGELLISGREWCDFFSYYPGIKSLLIRVYRNEEFLTKLKNELISFCSDLQTTINKIGE